MAEVTRRRRGPDAGRLQDIMAAAAEVFLVRGYDATSVQDIADAVGLLKGSLYHYVSSKEDFLFGIIEPVYTAALATVAPVADTDAEPLTRLAAFVRAHVKFFAANSAAFKIRIREFSQLSPANQESLRTTGEDYNAVLQKILTAARASGDLDPKLDVRLTTLTLIGELNSLTQWYHPEGRWSPRRLGDHFAGLIVTSVASDDAVTRHGGMTALRAL